jgi:hypothetical protein
MKRARMDNRFDPVVRKGALDHRSFGHRTDDVGVRSGCEPRSASAEEAIAGRSIWVFLVSLTP